MKMIISFKNFLIVFLLFVQIFSFNCEQQFDKFITKYDKVYATQQQKISRKQIYCQNLENIETFNAEDHPYKKGINKRSDWTNQEIKSLSTLLQLPNKEKTVRQLKVSAKVGTPTSLDWRDHNIITSVKDQGSCGSCWSFAAAAYAESRLIQLEQYERSLDFSEQYLLQCTPQSTCTGGYMENVMEQVTKQGLPFENTYPYSPFSRYIGICSAGGTHVAYQQFNYYRLSDDELIDLLQNGPVAIALSADDWNSYSSGTFYCSSNAQINHAVLLVGYDEDQWIIKNQWGTSWGMNGYMYITRNPSNNCHVGITAHILSENKLSIALWISILIILNLII